MNMPVKYTKERIKKERKKEKIYTQMKGEKEVPPSPRT